MIRILLLEDDKDDVELIGARYRAAGVAIEMHRVESRPAFREALERERWDVVLADYALPRFDGVAAVEMAQEMRPELPVIIISGVIAEDLAIETLQFGATDYVTKQHLHRLVPVTLRAVRENDVRQALLAEVEAAVEALLVCVRDLDPELAPVRRCAEPLERLLTLRDRLPAVLRKALPRRF